MNIFNFSKECKLQAKSAKEIEERFYNAFKCIATKSDMKMYNFARHFGIRKWTPNYSERRQLSLRLTLIETQKY